MPDTRIARLANNAEWQQLFQPGQLQQNGKKSHKIKLDEGWSWDAHFTVDRVCANPSARDFEKKYVVKAWHLTLELGRPNTVGYRRHAIHWIYDSATDRYVCKGWKPTFGKPEMPIFPELRPPAAVNRIDNTLSVLPFFDSDIAAEDQLQRTVYQRKILASINTVANKAKAWFGSSGIADAVWTQYRA